MKRSLVCVLALAAGVGGFAAGALLVLALLRWHG